MDKMDDLAMMRYLLGKYGMTDLVAMLRSTAANDPNLTAASISSASIKDGNPLSFDANPSPISFSDASSITGSIYSTCSDASSFANSVAPSPGGGQQSTGGHGQPSAAKAARKVVRRAAGAASKRTNLGGLGAAWTGKKQDPFECPFCGERGIVVEIKRKNDLKRHFHEFHANHSLWTCSAPNCGIPFEWKSAYTHHLKTAHSGVGPLPDDVTIKACPQTVFACGFSDCKRIFEAENDEEADKKAHEYFAHVADHFDGDGLTHKDWSYTARFRNLMRQSPIEEQWKRRTKLPGDTPIWHALTTFALRKMLESKHIGDASQFVRCATALGSAEYRNGDTSRPPTLPPQFYIPIKSQCRLAVNGHRFEDMGGDEPSQISAGDVPELSPFATPMPHFTKIEEDAMPKMDMMHAPLAFTGAGIHPPPMPPPPNNNGAWAVPNPHESMMFNPTAQDLSNTSFLFLDPDDMSAVQAQPSGPPLPGSEPTFGYWTDLLQSGIPVNRHMSQLSMDSQHSGMPNGYMARPDPPIMHPQIAQMTAAAAANKRRWSMRTTSSGKTIIPARDLESRPGSIMSTMFNFSNNQ